MRREGAWETCARHLINYRPGSAVGYIKYQLAVFTSVGVETTKHVNPPIAPPNHTFHKLLGAVVDSPRSSRLRLYE